MNDERRRTVCRQSRAWARAYQCLGENDWKRLLHARMDALMVEALTNRGKHLLHDCGAR